MRDKIRKWLLGNELARLWFEQDNLRERLADVEKAQRSDLTIKDLKEDLNKTVGILMALLRYSKLDWVTELEDDPHFPKPMPRQREVIKIKKFPPQR